MAFQGEYSTDWHPGLAFITLTIVPVIVMFFLAAQCWHIVAGLTTRLFEGLRFHEQSRHRHHRLRQHQRRLPEGWRRFPDPRHPRAGRSETSTAAQAAAAPLALRACSVDELLRDDSAIEIVVNLTIAAVARRGRRCRPSRPASTCTARSRCGLSARPRRSQLDRARPRAGPARRLRTRHIPERCASRPAGSSSTHGAIGRVVAGTRVLSCARPRALAPGNPAFYYGRWWRAHARHGARTTSPRWST